jgi:hypothetical protein
MSGDTHIMKVEKVSIPVPWEIWDALMKKAQMKEIGGDQGFLYIFKKEMKDILEDKVRLGKIPNNECKEFLENFKEYKDTDEVDLWLFW